MDLLPGPFIAQGLPPEYAGSGCGFRSTDVKSRRRNVNFNFLQAQKTDAFLWKMKGMKPCSLPFILWVLLGSSAHILSLRTAK